MDLQLKKLKDVYADNCVTIILNTHRTMPDNEKDPLTLKKLLKEAEERLHTHNNKRNIEALIARLEELASSIDHSHNTESLVLFVNDDIAEFARLPIAVKNRVVIDRTFAIRDLIRAIHLQSNYYVLVLSRQKARLLEVSNDKALTEISNGFPIENDQFYSTSKGELADAGKQTNLIAEFFNRIDKQVNEIRKEKSLPVLICTEESNYHEYMKIADQKQSIFHTILNKNRLDEKAHAIATEAWKIVKPLIKENRNARKASLQQAVSQQKFLSDTNEIWNAIKEGKVQTLFIEEDKFQPALIEDGIIKYVSEITDEKEIIDDIYDELIEANIRHGGEVVFLPKGELPEFNGLGAITRY